MSTVDSVTPARSVQRSARTSSAVSVQGVNKIFRLPQIQYHTLKERVLHPSSLNSFTQLRALEEVSFNVSAGEFFGVVGRNGSGKSTLLKCIAGIYAVDSGYIGVTGRLSPFIELGVGFNPELTARDNVLINGIMLGLSRREVRARFDEILAFAELEEYVDMKLKNFSSGMLVRLAFSVAIQVDADVLLIDEVLAVGDASFQQKCFDTFLRLQREGRTILFVTHDMGAVDSLCDRALLLERGRLVEIGDTETVTRRYNEVNFSQLDVASGDGSEEPRVGAAAIVDVWFEDEGATRITTCSAGQPVVACMRVVFRTTVENPQFVLVVRNELHHPILAATSQRTHGDLGRFEGQAAIVKVRFDNWLVPERYFLTAVVSQLDRSWDVLDHRPNAAALIVHGTSYEGGALVDLPYDLEIIRQQAGEEPSTHAAIDARAAPR